MPSHHIFSKRKPTARRIGQALAAGALFALGAVSAQAATYNWDPGMTPATPSGGTGIWDLTTPLWSDGATDQLWTDTTGTSDLAVFGGAAGTVTLNTNLGALGLVFTTPGYTLSGTGTLNVGTSGIDASALTSGTTTIGVPLALVGAQSWTVGAGSTLQVNGTVANGGSLLTLNGAGSVILGSAALTTPVISGTGGLTVGGTLGATSFANNTYSGATTIGAGSFLQLSTQATATYGATGAVTDNGTLYFAPKAGTTLTYGAAIGGTGALNEFSGGTTVLAVANTYTGATTIASGGVLAMKVQNAIASGSAVGVASGGTLQLLPGADSQTWAIAPAITLNGSTSSISSPSNNSETYNFNNTITLNNGGRISVFGINDTLNFKAAIGGTAGTSTGTTTTNNLIFEGTGNNSGVHIFTLSAANTYTGNTSLVSTTSPVTLKLGLAGALPATTTLNLVTGNSTNGKQATFDLAGFSQTIAGLNTVIGSSLVAANSEVINSAGTTATLTINNAATDTVPGLITGTLLGLSKTAGGTLILSGANTYTGGTTIAGGAIQMSGSGTLGAATNTLTINTGGTLDLNGTSQTVGVLGGTATAQAIGSGANGTVTLTVGSGNGSGAFGGILGDKAAISSGTPVVALVKTGTGTQTLTGLSTYTGGTTIGAGALSVAAIGNTGSSGNLGNGAISLGATTVAGTLIYTGNGETTNRAFSLTGTTGGGTLENDGAGALILSGGIAAPGVGAKTLTLQGTNIGASSIQGAIVNSSSGATAVTKAQAGTWQLTGASTYTGATTVSGGILALGNGGSLGATAVTATGGTFAATPGVNGATNAIGGNLTLNAAGNFSMADNATSTLSVAGNAVLAPASSTSPILTFDISGTAASDLLAVTGAATSGAAKATIYINGLSPGAVATGNTYTLITGGAGSTLATNAPTLGSVKISGPNDQAFGGSLSEPGGSSVVLTIGSVLGVDQAYYSGAIGTPLNATDGSGNYNFNTSATGGVNTGALPSSVTDVYFTTTTPTATNLTTTLGQNFTFNSLNFTASAPAVTINPDGSTLTINAGPGTPNGVNGLTVASGSAAQTLNVPITLGGTQTWTNNSANALTLGGLVTGGGKQLTVSGSGPVNFAGGITGLGTNSIFNSGTNVNITANSSFGILFANGNTTISSGTTSSASILVVDKTGVFTVSGTGILNSTAGGFRIGSTAGQAANFTVSGSGQVTTATSVEFSHAPTTVASNLNLNGGSFTTAAGFTMTSLGAVNFNGGTLVLNIGTAATPANIAASNAGNLALNVGSGGAVVDVGAAKSALFTQALAHSGTGTDGGLTKIDTGTLTLSGTSTYNGGTTVSNGILNAGSNAALGTGGLVLNPTTGNTATVNFTSTTPSVGSLASTGAGTSSLVLGNTTTPAATTLTIGGDNTSPVYSGTISDGTTANALEIGKLTKVGTGTQTLTGANTYTGTTTISAGALSGPTQAYSSGSVTVNTGGTADYTQNAASTYTASITGTGSVTVGGNPGGTLIPGGTITYTGVDSAAKTTVSAGSLLLNHTGGGALTGPVAIATNGGVALGSDNQIAPTSNVSLLGGTLAANAHNEGAATGGVVTTPGMGTLQIGDPAAAATASALDFGDVGGASATTLVFGDSSGLTWNGTVTLSNYTDGTDQLYIGTSKDLTPAQLSDIKFGGFMAGQNANGQITFAPTPEPSSLLSLLVGGGVLGGIVIRKRRQAV